MLQMKHNYEQTHAEDGLSASLNKLHSFKTLKAQDGVLTEFDERLWCSMVDYVTVGCHQGGRKKKLTVTFRGGTEVEA